MDDAHSAELLACRVGTSDHLAQALAANLREGVAVVDSDLRFLLWNRCMEKSTGQAAQDVIGRQVLDLFPSFQGLGIVRNLRRALAGKTVSAPAMIGRVHGKAGVIRGNDAHLFNEENLVWTILSYSPWRGKDGAIAGVIVVISDLTERVRARRQLKDSWARSQAVIDHMLDGMAMISGEGNIESFNLAAEHIFGYRAEEVIGRNIAMLVLDPLPCEQGCYSQHCPSTDEQCVGASREVLGLRRDESTFPLELVISKIELRGGHMFTALLRDISARKAAEEDLRVITERVRQLAAHQESVREAERNRIAHELHDELGGVLTAVRFDVNHLDHLPGIRPEYVKKLRDSLDAAIRSTRSIIADLRPPMIEQLGLWGAIEWYAGELASHRALHCQVIIGPGLEDVKLADDVSISLFRIVQEALSNVVKHAEARSIILCARRIAAAVIEVEIIDDGKGLRSEDLAKTGHWGVMGMRERVRSHGGELALKSVPGRGTTLRASLRID